MDEKRLLVRDLHDKYLKRRKQPKIDYTKTTLPECILDTIFILFYDDQDILNARLVCKRWYDSILKLFFIRVEFENPQEFITMFSMFDSGHITHQEMIVSSSDEDEVFTMHYPIKSIIGLEIGEILKISKRICNDFASKMKYNQQDMNHPVYILFFPWNKDCGMIIKTQTKIHKVRLEYQIIIPSKKYCLFDHDSMESKVDSQNPFDGHTLYVPKSFITKIIKKQVLTRHESRKEYKYVKFYIDIAQDMVNKVDYEVAYISFIISDNDHLLFFRRQDFIDMDVEKHMWIPLDEYENTQYIQFDNLHKIKKHTGLKLYKKFFDMIKQLILIENGKFYFVTDKNLTNDSLYFVFEAEKLALRYIVR